MYILAVVIMRGVRSAQGHMTTGHSVETQEFLTKGANALSSYALTCVALRI